MRSTYLAGNRRRGSTVIEFALAFVLIFTIFSGMFVFGYGFYIYNRLHAAVRLGGRYASLLAYDGTSDSAYKTAVRNMVVYTSPTAGSVPVIPGLATSHVEVTVTTANSKPELVRVYIKNYTIDSVFWKLPLKDKPSTAFRYEGRIAGL
jgi:Flp pilus assembly protein TadG